MNIAIDIDGVLADFVEAFFDYHNTEYGTNLKKSEVYNYSFSKVYGWAKEEEIRKIMEFYKTEYFLDTKPVEGAVSGVSSLKDENKLIIITARPENIVKETNDWLEKYFPKSFSEIYFTSQYFGGKHGKKSEICTNLGIDLLIEDSLDYALESANVGTRVLLLDSPWNQNRSLPNKVTRFEHWDEISNLL